MNSHHYNNLSFVILPYYLQKHLLKGDGQLQKKVLHCFVNVINDKGREILYDPKDVLILSPATQKWREINVMAKSYTIFKIYFFEQGCTVSNSPLPHIPKNISERKPKCRIFFQYTSGLCILSNSHS